MLELDRIYVGTLYFAYDYESDYLCNNLSKGDLKNYKATLYLFNKILKNGGIAFENKYLKNFINNEDGCSYKIIISLFYKIDDKYFSIFDGEEYYISNNLLKNTINLKEVKKLKSYLPQKYKDFSQIEVSCLNDIFTELFKSNINITDIIKRIIKRKSDPKSAILHSAKEYDVIDVISKEPISNVLILRNIPLKILLEKNQVPCKHKGIKREVYQVYRLLVLDGKCLQCNLDWEQIGTPIKILSLEDILKMYGNQVPNTITNQEALRLYKKMI